MSDKSNADDARIIMQLYDLRREAEMRKARVWFAGWWPRSADEIVQMINSPANLQENAWFRQVVGYWEMAASFVLRGALNEELFFDSGGELWFVLAKIHLFLEEARQKANSPYLLQRMEKVAARTEEGRERFQMMLKRAEARRAALAAKAS